MSDDIVRRLQVDYVVDEHTWEELEQFALRNEAADAIKARDEKIAHMRTAGDALVKSLRKHITTCEYFGLQTSPLAKEVIANWLEATEEKGGGNVAG